MKRLRWKIIEWLDRNVSICWADLVMWANDPDSPFREIPEPGCARRCFRMGGDAYCGKCVQIRPFGPYWEVPQ